MKLPTYTEAQDIELPESAIRWLKGQMADRSGMSYSVEELKQAGEDTPEFFTKELDSAYRQGFTEGVSYALDIWSEGVVKRSSLWERIAVWFDTILMKWIYLGEGRYQNFYSHHPTFGHTNLDRYKERLPMPARLKNGERVIVQSYNPEAGKYCFSVSEGYSTWDVYGKARETEFDIDYVIDPRNEH